RRTERGEGAMARTRFDHTPAAPTDEKRRNLLLAGLPPDDYARVAPHLELVPLRLRQMLHQPGTPIRHFYFPADGFCSQLTVMADGRMVEVATVGREGVVGLLGDSGHGTLASAAMVQAPCLGGKLPAAVFQREMSR